MGESGNEPTSSEGGDSSDIGDPSFNCPSDVDVFGTAPRSVAVENLDEGAFGDDQRFVDSFCESYCPAGPDDYELSYCAPVDELDVPPPADSTGTSDGGSDTDTTGGSETSGSTSESTDSTTSSTTSSSTTGDDDELIEIRCHYWPGCM